MSVEFSSLGGCHTRATFTQTRTAVKASRGNTVPGSDLVSAAEVVRLRLLPIDRSWRGVITSSGGAPRLRFRLVAGKGSVAEHREVVVDRAAMQVVRDEVIVR
ncbi:hypothetical protein ACFO5K_04430 [Nocardia halotolerans]|uniref:Uncharacterized protein n=1 Tax=Nocardia halotolerans TaxID=1755878 RepID=A0ABV8VBM7_9NOCA